MASFFQRIFATQTRPAPRTDAKYTEVISRTAQMVRNETARTVARSHGLEILDLTWEDTGRYKGSCVGPNISDMTIQVRDEATNAITCMPVIRYPNFSDKTADVSIDDVFVRVGNENGRDLRRVCLREYLRDLRKYLHEPASWKGDEESLLAPREKEVLVSAQACFLPIPAAGRAEFNPVLFNYQSYAGAPAVLAIVVTREGTSATIIDNQRDGFGAGSAWGQRLFFNHDGERASFTGTRMDEFVSAGGDNGDKPATVEDAKAAGLDCVMLIQVPLLQPQLPRRSMATMAPGMAICSAAAPQAAKCEEECDVEAAVIGHGEVEGPFTEIDNLAIKRDARFPIRVTVQFYKATSNGVVSASEMKAIAQQIEAVYADARAVGSLVTDPDRGRSTEWDDEGKGKKEPGDWWARFWAKQEAATGKTRTQLMADLERLLGRKPSTTELEDAIRRVFGS